MAIKDAKEYICALGVDNVMKTYGKENVPKGNYQCMVWNAR